MGNENKSGLPGKICGSILLTGFLAGFSGFLLGLIFAPQSGKNFRKLLARKALEILDRSKFAMIEAKVRAEELLDKTREKDIKD